MKRFIYKVYNQSGTFLSTIHDVVDVPRFSSYINSGLSELTIRLPRTVKSFQEGTVIAQGNQIKVVCIDTDSPSGTTIYGGFISKYTPTLQQGNEFIQVTCLGFSAQFERYLLEDNGSGIQQTPTSGNTTLNYLSKDPSNILKDVLDKFTAKGGKATYSGSSVSLTGTTTSYQFNTNTVKEALDNITELSPNGWYYYVDADNVVKFKGKDSTANHTFYIGNDVISIIPEKSTENMCNTVYFTGGEVTGTQIFKKYTRAGSIATYGRYEQKCIDSRVTDVSTMDIIANSILDRGDAPETRTTLVIMDNNKHSDDATYSVFGAGEGNKIGYDIESIKPGDTCRIMGFSSENTSVWDKAIWGTDKWDYDITQVSAINQQIMAVHYEPNKVTLEISSKLPNISHRVEDIKRNMDQIYTNHNPSRPLL